MAYKEGTVIIKRSTNTSFLVIIQDKNRYVLAPLKIDGFTKKPEEWVFVWELEEQDYRIDSNYRVINNVKEFFEYSSDEEYKLTEEEIEVLLKCQQRKDYVPNSLLSNISLISSFAEMLGVNRGELVKKIMCIAGSHPDYEEEVQAKVKEKIETRDKGINLLDELGYS